MKNFTRKKRDEMPCACFCLSNQTTPGVQVYIIISCPVAAAFRQIATPACSLPFLPHLVVSLALVREEALLRLLLPRLGFFFILIFGRFVYLLNPNLLFPGFWKVPKLRRKRRTRCRRCRRGEGDGRSAQRASISSASASRAACSRPTSLPETPGSSAAGFKLSARTGCWSVPKCFKSFLISSAPDLLANVRRGHSQPAPLQYALVLYPPEALCQRTWTSTTLRVFVVSLSFS
jgi:hypothetical protein